MDTHLMDTALLRTNLHPWPLHERLLRLSQRYKAHKAAGRTRAAMACKELAMRIVEQTEENAR